MKRNSKKFTEIDIKLFKEKIILFSKENTCSIVLNSNNSSSTYDLVFAYGVNSHISSSMNSLQKLDSFISCLLYTSPSPRDVEESRMPSSAWKKKKEKRRRRCVGGGGGGVGCFFFFNDTATTEIYTRKIVGSVRCV